MITVTWVQGDTTEVFTLPDTLLESFESYRKSITVSTQVAVTDSTGGSHYAIQSTPKYSTIRELIVEFFVTQLVNPVVTKFPPSELAALQAAAETAAAALKAAQTAALASFTTATAASSDSTTTSDTTSTA
jgi:hypothetical protein